ncbi:MAG: ATP-binding cassette domain-containing protein [Acidobacteria bacterium]|nr:ATP-binding cassette domain-containing protein [Acidobacteriota bacterium]
MIPTFYADSLTRRFGNVVAVDQVSLHVNAGEVVGLLGPNGAGKTTILRMIAGILEPDSGAVYINGQNLSDDPLAAKQAIGFHSGDTQLYQRLNPREALQYFGRLYGMTEPALSGRIQKLISELEMEAYAERPCSTLSSGQRQRANIARAFLHEPDLLILDEPTNALDIVSGQFIVEAIRRERAAGRAVLFSTHIMGEAEYLCDRIALLHKGRIVDEGSLPELLHRAGSANLTDAFLKIIRSGDREDAA